MNATLNFKLPEDNDDFKLATEGRTLWCALWDVDQKLRSVLKYGHKYKSVEDLAQDMRDLIWEAVDMDMVS